MKECRGCGEIKPITQFYKHSTGKDGYRNYCKSCAYEKQKDGLNKANARRIKREYYERNRDKSILRSKLWRQNNKERYNSYMTKVREKDPEFYKARARGYSLKRKFGITVEQYDELLEKQNGCCALCDRHHSEFDNNLSVDHSHKTGRIRGLLCTHCNYRLVARHEDGALLRKIADYIEQGTEWFVPEKKKRRKRAKSKT